MVISFTGHRTFDHEAHYPALYECVESLCENVDCKIQFLSGMAAGFDLSAAEVVLEIHDRAKQEGKRCDIELHAIVPFYGHEKIFKGDEHARYLEIIDRADCVIYLEERYSHGVYFRRNNYLVERADRMIAYYDGGKQSGTAYTVRRAKKLQVEVDNIYPNSQLSMF